MVVHSTCTGGAGGFWGVEGESGPRRSRRGTQGSRGGLSIRKGYLGGPAGGARFPSLCDCLGVRHVPWHAGSGITNPERMCSSNGYPTL